MILVPFSSKGCIPVPHTQLSLICLHFKFFYFLLISIIVLNTQLIIKFLQTCMVNLLRIKKKVKYLRKIIKSNGCNLVSELMYLWAAMQQPIKVYNITKQRESNNKRLPFLVTSHMEFGLVTLAYITF